MGPPVVVSSRRRRLRAERDETPLLMKGGDEIMTTTTTTNESNPSRRRGLRNFFRTTSSSSSTASSVSASAARKKNPAKSRSMDTRALPGLEYNDYNNIDAAAAAAAAVNNTMERAIPEHHEDPTTTTVTSGSSGAEAIEHPLRALPANPKDQPTRQRRQSRSRSMRRRPWLRGRSRSLRLRRSKSDPPATGANANDDDIDDDNNNKNSHHQSKKMAAADEREESAQRRSDEYYDNANNHSTSIDDDNKDAEHTQPASPATATESVMRSSESLRPSPSRVVSERQATRSTPVPPVLERLQRPFGRSETLVPSAGVGGQQRQQQFVVEVSSPEWDETHWKYRILIQRRKCHRARAAQQQQPEPGTIPTAASFTTAFCWRTVADFQWLEQALLDEFAGGLLIPRLELVVPTWDPTAPWPAEPLKHWLADLLNGVRGQGEVVLPYAMQNDGDEHHSNHEPMEASVVLASDSMEAFLYHATGPAPATTRNAPPGSPSRTSAGGTVTTASSTSGGGGNTHSQQQQQHSPLRKTSDAVWQTLGHSLDVLCGGQNSSSVASSEMQGSGPRRPQRMPASAAWQSYSSKALATAPSLDVLDSLADHPGASLHHASSGGMMVASGTTALHTEGVLAQHALLQDTRKCTIACIGTVQTLLQRDQKWGSAWQSLAVALANLFAYEKQMESTKLSSSHGSGSGKQPHHRRPFAKIGQRGSVEDHLRKLSQAKIDRERPGLEILQAMLEAYMTDLSAVDPSVRQYTQAVHRVHELKEGDLEDEDENETNQQSGVATSGSWEGRIRQTVDGVAQQAKQTWNEYSGASGSAGTDHHSSSSNNNKHLSKEVVAAQRLAIQHQQFLDNEQLLLTSLNKFCQTTTQRTSRMAWHYFQTEASQCARLHTAALATAQELVPPKREAVARMIERHMVEDKQDATAELELVERMLQVGSGIDDAAAMGRRQKALRLAKERLGRWNSELSSAILEAVGVNDPNVRLDATTRDLRLVRKHAMGLRESVNRCVEMVEALKECMTERGQSLRDLRHTLVKDLAKLWSGQFFLTDHSSKQPKSKAALPSLSLLGQAGADLSDPFGWSEVYSTASSSALTSSARKTAATQPTGSGQVGRLALAYTDLREAQTEWLITSLSDLLDDYYKRVEALESYVCMECVGIQLETTFSQRRTEALTTFEKRTDLTSAVNVATRKNLPKLVADLQERMAELGPEVTHTHVKEAKDAHLLSKALKDALHKLATRRLMRVREASTERIVALASMWAKEEEGFATSELKSVGETLTALEKAVMEYDQGRNEEI